MFIVIFLFFLIFNSFKCFNIDVSSPIVYVDPLENSSSDKASYFGYSVVLYPGKGTKEPWILIGAPRGSSDDSSVNPGVGLRCGIKKHCNILNSLTINKEMYLKNHSWIGGSMDISYTQNRVVTCAPRQIVYASYEVPMSDYFLNGLCYWFDVNDKKVKNLYPMEGENAIRSGKENSIYKGAFAQAGFSVHFPNSEENELLLGAPGFLDWRGTSVLYKDHEAPGPIASRLIRLPRDIEELGNKVVVAAENNDMLGLLGYSTTSGYFFNKKTLYYVSGAPRAHNYHGQVVVYDLDENKPLNSIRLNGFQFGEYFGASVTAGDINHDGFEDLMVGAPFHTIKNYNEGRMYVYMGGSKFSQLALSIDGRSTNGQFGTCVQFLGDINADGFGDVAVAAPYEEGSGVVYLYSGTRNGLAGQYSQRIVGKDISATIRGFGISISRAADVDRNTYSDLAIGAHLSGHVLLLRTSPVVTVKHALESYISNLNIDQTEFQMRACYSFKTKNLSFRISIRRTIDVDVQFGRARLKDTQRDKPINLEKNKEFCENFTLTLQKSSNTFNPVSVSLSHEFISNMPKKSGVYIYKNEIVGTDNFCSSCPVYNEDKSSKLQTIEIPFALGCGSDNICNANIEFESKMTGVGEDNTFTLGSRDLLTLETVVRNLGERAYLTQIVFTLPEIVHLDITPSACVQQNRSTVVCSVDSPLDTNVEKMVFLPLDMSTVNKGRYDLDSLDFTIMVLTSSINRNDNIKTLQIKLKREADVKISGQSQEETYSYGDLQKPINFIQSFQVEKFGSSILNEILIEIDIPRNINTEKGSAFNFSSLDSFTGRLDDQEFTCTENDNVYKGEKNLILTNSVNDNYTDDSRKVEHGFYINCNMPEVECSKLTCTVGPIESGQIAKIELKFIFNVPLIKNLLETNDVIYLGTRGLVKVKNPPEFVQSGDQPDMVEVISMFVGQGVEEKVALWIIIVSIIASLILLALVMYILYKIGFFRRTVKEELEQIKNEMETNEADTLQEEQL